MVIDRVQMRSRHHEQWMSSLVGSFLAATPLHSTRRPIWRVDSHLSDDSVARNAFGLSTSLGNQVKKGRYLGKLAQLGQFSREYVSHDALQIETLKF